MVAFENDDIEEANPVAAPEDSAPTPKMSEYNRKVSLSQSAKAWDIDGDGVLDETELALRKMDHKRSGTLNNGQIYKLMNDNLTTQREFFKLKKVMIV